MDSIKQSALYGRIAGAIICLSVILKTQLDIDIGPEEIQAYVNSVLLGISGLLTLASKIREQFKR